MGASAFLKSVDFRAFAVNVKTIASTQKLYQSGHAIWWGDMPMAVYSFLDEYDLSGKTVLPFCTHGGSGLCQTDKNIQSEEKDAKVIDGMAISDSSLDDADGDIDQWLKNNGVPNV